MVRGITVFLLLAACATARTLADAQELSGSTLVVVVEGEKQYHQPACPVVAKAGSHVQVMKLAEATRRGLTPHDCQGAAIDEPTKDANAAIVFVQAGDKRYHKKGCAKLGSKATTTTLGDAGRRYWPCPVCKPPIRQREKK